MKNEPLTRALLLEQQGDWNNAHRIVQQINSNHAAWVHAYLHRVEGDPGNAAYWYHRAGKPVCTLPLADEWKLLFDALS